MVVWVGDGAPCNWTLTRPGCAADPRRHPRRGAGRRLRQGPAGEGSPWLRRAKTTGGADVRGPEAIIAEMIECIPEVDKAVLRGHSPGALELGQPPGALELGQPPGDRTLGRQRLSLRSPGQARYGSLLYGRPQSDRAPRGQCPLSLRFSDGFQGTPIPAGKNCPSIVSISSANHMRPSSARVGRGTAQGGFNARARSSCEF